MSEQRKEYVVGLLLDDRMEQIVLLQKRHGPEAVIGQWNGVGGKIEPGENMHEAMVREFQEETDLATEGWQHFCSLRGPSYTVHFLWATGDVSAVKTMTDEPVCIFPIDCLPEPIMHNLTWMIPFVRDDDVDQIGEIPMGRG